MNSRLQQFFISLSLLSAMTVLFQGCSGEETFNADDRRYAEIILNKGGKFTINEMRVIKSLDQLPNKAYEITGVDFNNTSLHHKDVLKATQYLLSKGVTTFFPTLITNADDNVLKLLETLRLACEKYPLVEAQPELRSRIGRLGRRDIN